MRCRENDLRRGARLDSSLFQVLLLVSPRHTPGFIRLLQSGLGRVVGRSIPFQGDVGSLTHAIIDPNRLKELPGDHLAELCRAGVHCCVSEYLGEKFVDGMAMQSNV